MHFLQIILAIYVVPWAELQAKSVPWRRSTDFKRYPVETIYEDPDQIESIEQNNYYDVPLYQSWNLNPIIDPRPQRRRHESIRDHKSWDSFEKRLLKEIQIQKFLYPRQKHFNLLNAIRFVDNLHDIESRHMPKGGPVHSKHRLRHDHVFYGEPPIIHHGPHHRKKKPQDIIVDDDFFKWMLKIWKLRYGFDLIAPTASAKIVNKGNIFRTYPTPSGEVKLVTQKPAETTPSNVNGLQVTARNEMPTMQQTAVFATAANDGALGQNINPTPRMTVLSQKTVPSFLNMVTTGKRLKQPLDIGSVSQFQTVTPTLFIETSPLINAAVSHLKNDAVLRKTGLPTPYPTTNIRTTSSTVTSIKHAAPQKDVSVTTGEKSNAPIISKATPLPSVRNVPPTVTSSIVPQGRTKPVGQSESALPVPTGTTSMVPQGRTKPVGQSESALPVPITTVKTPPAQRTSASKSLPQRKTSRPIDNSASSPNATVIGQGQAKKIPVSNTAERKHKPTTPFKLQSTEATFTSTSSMTTPKLRNKPTPFNTKVESQTPGTNQGVAVNTVQNSYAPSQTPGELITSTPVIRTVPSSITPPPPSNSKKDKKQKQDDLASSAERQQRNAADDRETFGVPKTLNGPIASEKMVVDPTVNSSDDPRVYEEVGQNDGYGAWSVWGPCNKTCGLGRKQRSRSCYPSRGRCTDGNIELSFCVQARCDRK